MPDFNLDLPSLPLAEEMRKWDAAAMSFGIPENMLMENAARSCLSLLQTINGPVRDKKVLVLMGGGNNGGDAACLARHILDLGGQPLVWHLKDNDKLSGACAWHTKLALKAGVEFKKISLEAGDCAGSLFGGMKNFPDIIIDGLLGTGFSGTLKPALAEFMEAVNSFNKFIKAFVLAVDIPSGLDSTTGNPSPVAIKASATATLAAAKPGMLLPHARQWTGDVYIRGIGMPRSTAHPAAMRLVDGRILLNGPNLPKDSYKNVYGHVTVIGGSYGMGGAAHLASAAALRTGAGLVTVCAPDSSIADAKSGWPEIMTHSLGTDWPDKISDSLDSLLKKSSALVIGPGMGRTRASEAFLYALLNLDKRPATVFDADALTILGRNAELLAKLDENDIITPHPGEAGALLGMSAREIQDYRSAAVEKLAALSPAVAILKGAATLIRQNGGPTFICPYDVPQMAIGGAGDVLSGCLGALLARAGNDKSALGTAAYGVMMHVAAGLVCARKFPNRGATATALADAIAESLVYVQHQDKTNLNLGFAPWPA